MEHRMKASEDILQNHGTQLKNHNTQLAELRKDIAYLKENTPNLQQIRGLIMECLTKKTPMVEDGPSSTTKRGRVRRKEKMRTLYHALGPRK